MDVFFAHVDLVSGFVCSLLFMPMDDDPNWTCVPHGLSMGAAEAFSAVSFKICHAPVWNVWGTFQYWNMTVESMLLTKIVLVIGN
jgi:hypothetical protein